MGTAQQRDDIVFEDFVQIQFVGNLKRLGYAVRHGMVGDDPHIVRHRVVITRVLSRNTTQFTRQI